jgi:surface polysaccharide O-acyltransferase-like enzyme
MEQRGGRIAGFDSLRFLMIVCVVMLHAAMSYMEFVPQWWYAIDDNRSLAFTILVVFLDSFPMSALFFLAGYFAPPAYAKRRAHKFIRDKFIRIGIPWITGVIFIAPFFAYASFVKYDGLGEASGLDFVSKWFFGPFYQQAHYWFLGVLFLFLVIYAAFAGKTKLERHERKRPVAAPIAALFFFSILAYYLASVFIKPAVEWVNICYILYFQHARFVGYVGLFALGVYGWESEWFKPGGWSPNPTSWGAVGFLSSCLLICWKFFLEGGLAPNVNLWLDAILYNVVMISMTIFLAGIFMGTKETQFRTLQNLSQHTYPIYWLHQIILMPAVLFLKPYSVNIFIKWVLACAVTLAVGFMLSKLMSKLKERLV